VNGKPPSLPLEKTEGTPIDVNCRLCERENCSQRAEPPITRTLILDENTWRVSSSAFSNAREL
jgi:predicted transcriptional regulator